MRLRPAQMSTKAITRWVVVLTAIGSLMAALDTLVVSTALSTIRLDLGASIEQLEWTVNAYNLSFAVLLVTGAALGDRFGRRRLFAVGLGVFAAASAVSALAPSVGWLISARAVQGAGSALIMPLGLALLSAAFPPEKRGAAIGIFSAITGIAVAAGPLVGGAVVEGVSWEWIFWVNVPIGLAAIPLVLTRMRESYGSDTGLDIPGLALVPTAGRSTHTPTGCSARRRTPRTVQDSLLGAWRGLARFEGRSSLRSWLYRIATNASLKIIERRPKRVLPIDYGPPAHPGDPPGEPLVESVWIEPVADERLGLGDGHASPEARYEQRESVELAFIAALQHLPPRQRAVLILRYVLGFSAREAAEVLETAPASIDSALQRAHQTVDERLPEQDQQATLRTLDDAALRRVVDGYVDAWERDDVDAVAALLTDDAVFAMPPQATWFRGREAVAAFLGTVPMGRGYRWRMIPIRANGQLAFGHYMWSEELGAFGAHGINVLSLDGDRISEINLFKDPEAFARFGLPEELADGLS